VGSPFAIEPSQESLLRIERPALLE
jgi:hypothetical protein